MTDEPEYEKRKRAIFDTMSKRGQERILRIGYENWDPFQEPKDPRERIFGSSSLQAKEIVRGFFIDHPEREDSAVIRKELFDLARGLLQEDTRARTIYDFFKWFIEKRGSSA